MKKYIKLLVFPVLFLVACSNQNDVSDDFENKVFYNVDDPQQYIMFFENALRIDPEESVKPYMTDQDLEDMTENYSDYEPQNYENIKVLETNDSTYEVIDSETEEVVFEFKMDNDSDKLITEDSEYLPLN